MPALLIRSLKTEGEESPFRLDKFIILRTIGELQNALHKEYMQGWQNKGDSKVLYKVISF
jgi:hypothetical protein